MIRSLVMYCRPMRYENSSPPDASPILLSQSVCTGQVFPVSAQTLSW